MEISYLGNEDGVMDKHDKRGRRYSAEEKAAAVRMVRTLQVAPSTYYAARGRVPSARALNDVMLSPQLCDLWKNNFQVYGVRKLWKVGCCGVSDSGIG